MPYLDFDEAQEAHRRVYPIPDIPIYYPHDILSGAGAFEGMHHWEHEARQCGTRVSRDDARSLLKTLVANDTNTLLSTIEEEIIDRGEILNNATEQAMHLYDRQYGDAEWYDPGQMEAHETMKGQWREGAF